MVSQRKPLSDLATVRRIEDADGRAGLDFVDATARLRPAADAASRELCGGYALFSGESSPVNQALACGLRGAVAAEELGELEEFFAMRGAAVELELASPADAGFMSQLRERGYGPSELSHCLARQVADFEVSRKRDDSLKVEIVPFDRSEEWASLVMSGFMDGVSPAPELVEVMKPAAATTDGYCMIATLDGTAAGGGFLQLKNGAALLSGHSTLPSFRGRGVQSMLIEKSLAIAREKGCDLAAAFTVPASQSQRNFERYGFSLTHFRIKFVKGKTG